MDGEGTRRRWLSIDTDDSDGVRLSVDSFQSCLSDDHDGSMTRRQSIETGRSRLSLDISENVHSPDGWTKVTGKVGGVFGKLGGFFS